MKAITSVLIAVVFAMFTLGVEGQTETWRFGGTLVTMTWVVTAIVLAIRGE